jgi:hypothetical protein
VSDDEERERWIPVTERLPDDNVPVALVAGRAVAAGELYRGLWYHTLPQLVSRQIAGVTHWMPLPEPPEVEQGEEVNRG